MCRSLLLITLYCSVIWTGLPLQIPLGHLQSSSHQAGWFTAYLGLFTIACHTLGPHLTVGPMAPHHPPVNSLLGNHVSDAEYSWVGPDLCLLPCPTLSHLAPRLVCFPTPWEGTHCPDSSLGTQGPTPSTWHLCHYCVNSAADSRQPQFHECQPYVTRDTQHFEAKGPLPAGNSEQE